MNEIETRICDNCYKEFETYKNSNQNLCDECDEEIFGDFCPEDLGFSEDF